jgi:hypothetical protein
LRRRTPHESRTLWDGGRRSTRRQFPGDSRDACESSRRVGVNGGQDVTARPSPGLLGTVRPLPPSTPAPRALCQRHPRVHQIKPLRRVNLECREERAVPPLSRATFTLGYQEASTRAGDTGPALDRPAWKQFANRAPTCGRTIGPLHRGFKSSSPVMSALRSTSDPSSGAGDAKRIVESQA